MLSAADDEAVDAFLTGDLRFNDIPAVVETVIEEHEPAEVTLDSLGEVDGWARAAAVRAIAKRRSRR